MCPALGASIPHGGIRTTLALALALALALTWCSERSAWADTAVCVAVGKEATVDCSKSTFNIHMDFQDAAAKDRFLAYVKAQFASQAELHSYLGTVNGRLDSQRTRIARVEAELRVISEKVAEAERRRNSEALLTSETARQYEDLKRRQNDLEQLFQQLQATLVEFSSAQELALDVLLANDVRAEQRLTALEREVSKRRSVPQKPDGNAFHYDRQRHRLLVLPFFGIAIALRSGSESQATTSVGLSVGYQVPGHWVLMPTASVERMSGAGTAIVTDPKQAELGVTPSWRTTAYGLGLRFLLGREYRGWAWHVSGGWRWQLARHYQSVEFGEQTSNAGGALPFGGGVSLRPLVGLTARLELGAVYWPDGQPARYEYRDPTAAAVLARATTIWELSFTIGLGYALSF
jgi:hypothetical protein